MEEFQLLAHPWWVNLLILVPFIAYFFWKEKKLNIQKQTLLTTAIFSAAFGFVEAAVVIYLRIAIGLNPETQALSLSNELPQTLFAIEIFREIATIIMLVSIALLSVKATKERFAVFLWTFAAWDIFYYVGLWLAVGWPSSLLTQDILFLIPVPWISQVWFPVLVSLLGMLAVILARKNKQ